jgi:hypothetical protein
MQAGRRSSSLTSGIKEYRSFAWILGGIVALVFGLLLPLAFGAPPRWWAIGGGLGFAAFGTVAPTALAPVYRAWMAIGHILGLVNTFLLLHFVFYIILSPMGVLMRIFRKDPLLEGHQLSLPTYRKASQPQARERMKEMF